MWFAYNLVARRLRWQVLDPAAINVLALAFFLLACAAVAFVALTAARRPRLAQLAFLLVAALILTNKVYSPQYVLWLIPLLALARPRWRDFLVWQGRGRPLLGGHLDVPGAGDQPGPHAAQY